MRASAIFTTFAQLTAAVLALLEEGCELIVVRAKDRFNFPTDFGYQDMLLNVKIEGSEHVGELQLHLQSIIGVCRRHHQAPCAGCPVMREPTLTLYTCTFCTAFRYQASVPPDIRAHEIGWLAGPLPRGRSGRGYDACVAEGAKPKSRSVRGWGASCCLYCIT